jgi:hypothetical protein
VDGLEFPPLRGNAEFAAIAATKLGLGLRIQRLKNVVRRFEAVSLFIA